MRRGLSAAAVLLSVLALTAACGDDASPGGGSDTGTGGATEPTTIEVTLDGDSSSPEGDRVDDDLGQPVDLVITADRAGEIHVHSSPEQTFAFDAGTNDPIELTFDRAGLVEVEFHEPIDAPIVELKVH
jgi:hypothetical protein